MDAMGGGSGPNDESAPPDPGTDAFDAWGGASITDPSVRSSEADDVEQTTDYEAGQPNACHQTILSDFSELADGRSVGRVKVVGSLSDLQDLWDQWTRGGETTFEGPSRTQVQLPDGTTVQWRDYSDSGGETIDVQLPGSRTILKVHIVK